MLATLGGGHNYASYFPDVGSATSSVIDVATVEQENITNQIADIFVEDPQHSTLDMVTVSQERELHKLNG